MRILVLGKANTVFVRQFARDLSAQGYVVTIIGNQQTEAEVGSPVEVINLSKFNLGIGQRIATKLLVHLVAFSDWLSMVLATVFFLPNFTWVEYRNSPPMKRAIMFAMTLKHALNGREFDAIYCHHVYFYGVAGLLFAKGRVVVHPWGSDIHKYSISSPVRLWLTRQVFRKADKILVASVTINKFIAETFRVAPGMIESVNYTIDEELFTQLPGDERVALRLRLDVPADKVIIFSCRRFVDGWGPHIIRDAFVRATSNPDLYFIVLSGYKSNTLVDEFERVVESKGLAHRFRFIKDMIPIEQYAEYCQVSDYLVSAMTNTDMRSFSILQGVACGACPILSQQLEYDQMVIEGFNYIKFDGTADALTTELDHLKAGSKALVDSNLHFIQAYNDTQYISVIDSILGRTKN